MRPAVAALAMLLSGAGAASAQRAQECGGAPELATLIEWVRDHTTRVPLPAALVTASWANDERTVRVRTDSAGQARLCAPPDRIITLRITYQDVTTTQTVQLSSTRITQHVSNLEVPGVAVRGRVAEKSTGESVAHVTVRLLNTPLITYTNADGRFFFGQVPAGTYTLHIEHIAYAASSAALNVGTEDLDATVRLTPAAIPLEPITVTAFSRKLDRTGFYERQKRGTGTFIDRKQIDAMRAQRASDLLRDVPSMRLIPQPSRRNSAANLTLGRGQCRYRFAVDGAPTLDDFEIDLMVPWAIEGIEVYNGLAQVPAMFRVIATQAAGSAVCGLIVIWTREGR